MISRSPPQSSLPPSHYVVDKDDAPPANPASSGNPARSVNPGTVFYRDDNGRARAKVAEPFQLIGTFLTFEVAGSLPFTDTLIERSTAALQAQAAAYTLMGDSFEIAIDREKVSISDATRPDSASITLETTRFIAFLQCWRRLLSESF